MPPSIQRANATIAFTIDLASANMSHTPTNCRCGNRFQPQFMQMHKGRAT
ncbi:hypothetical protein RMSM_00947 [Rhodopirellula maiorica SM1]|uniref:Uncharacterized protein n=1 Tax=Rhodopirellula maiorica SM1 TaxID=1265738 RepID=M5S3B1_9BACT|nr:hypothetical protein RMSM_00947 [Rhodopirellula maiorica SM1]